MDRAKKILKRIDVIQAQINNLEMRIYNKKKNIDWLNQKLNQKEEQK
jgi:peptidoglycan hydrolase CwlO-like protein